jgi:metal transporter CNNM
MSLDYNKLVIKSRSGTTAEMRQAKSVLPLLSNHHFLLVSLMLWNASATEILPIYLNKLVPEYAAIIMSVTLVLFLGEILPASILTGPNQLFICSSLRHVVYAVFIIFSPVAYPISYCLDYFLGQHHHSATTISRLELSTMVKLQQEEHESRKKLGARVGADEVTDEEIAMIEGVLKFSQKIVNEVMNVDIFMLNINDKLDFEVSEIIDLTVTIITHCHSFYCAFRH